MNTMTTDRWRRMRNGAADAARVIASAMMLCALAYVGSLPASE
ncbi:hypothetical protein P3T40_006779 [Paraburkholderia sp. EB58]